MICALCWMPVDPKAIRDHVCQITPPVPAWAAAEWPTPKGYRPVRAYVSATDLVIIGDPAYDESEDEAAHNCDESGCGQEHVLLRVALTEYQQAKLTRALCEEAPAQ